MSCYPIKRMVRWNTRLGYDLCFWTSGLTGKWFVALQKR